jgi:hypothetical protein
MAELCGSSLSASVDRLGRSGVHEDLAAGVQGEDNEHGVAHRARWLGRLVKDDG